MDLVEFSSYSNCKAAAPWFYVKGLCIRLCCETWGLFTKWKTSQPKQRGTFTFSPPRTKSLQPPDTSWKCLSFVMTCRSFTLSTACHGWLMRSHFPYIIYRQLMGAWCPCPTEVNVLEPPASLWNIPAFVKISLAFYFLFPFLAKIPLLGIKASTPRTESKLSTSEWQP